MPAGKKKGAGRAKTDGSRSKPAADGEKSASKSGRSVAGKKSASRGRSPAGRGGPGAKAESSRRSPALSLSELESTVREVVAGARVVDASTRLRPPVLGSGRSAGIDDLLDEPALAAEAIRSRGIAPQRFWNLSRERRCEFIWKELFVEGAPISNASRGVLHSLTSLGLSPRRGDLASLRKWFAGKKPEWLLDTIFAQGGIDAVVAAVDPFVEIERRRWVRGVPADGRFLYCLELDGLLWDWPRASQALAQWDYAVSLDFAGETEAEVTRFVREWADRTDAVTFGVCLPPGFRLPHPGPAARLIENVLFPECERRKRPILLRVGEVGSLNPGVGEAAGGRRPADLDAVERLLRAFAGTPVLLHGVARGNEEEITALACAFGELHPTGAAPGPASPLARSMLIDRLGVLGAGFTPFVSRAACYERLLPTWSAARACVVDALLDRYRPVVESDFGVSVADLRADARALLGRSFLRACGLEA